MRTLLPLIFTLIVLTLHEVSPATLRELYQINYQPNQNNSAFAVLDRKGIIADHMEMAKKLDRQHSRHENWPNSELPKTNKRNIILHTLNLLRQSNPQLYKTKKDEFKQQILDKKKIDEKVRNSELELLEKYDSIATCHWNTPLPPIFPQSSQCWLQEYEFVFKNIPGLFL